MSVADEVSTSICLGKSEITIQGVNPVEFTQLDTQTDINHHIIQKINEYRQKGYKTIAITRVLHEVDILYTGKLTKTLINSSKTNKKNLINK